MQRARRLASVAVVAALAVTALSACRSDPEVAAYVGAQRITEDRVSQVLADAKSKVAGTAQAAPITRQDVLTTLVGLDVMQEIAKQRNLSPTTVPVDQVAQSLGLRADSTYVALFTEYRGLLSAISTGAKPATPTQADLRDVYNKLTAAGGNPQNQTFQQFTTGISAQDQQTLQQNIGLRNDLEAQIAKLKTVINPRYTAPELPLVSLQDAQGKQVPLVTLSFVPGRPAPIVTDLPLS